jgi:hypothetical protein
MFLQPDGRIMVCGDFSEIIDGSFFNRPQRGHIARFTAAGFLDGTFTTNIGADNAIEAMALQPNGRTIIVGAFKRYNLPDIGQPDNRLRVARVLPNGDLDNAFNPGTGLNDTAYAVARLATGKALIGGKFTTYNGVSRAQLLRVLAGPANSGPGALFLLLGD